jgi:hypothetical protein
MYTIYTSKNGETKKVTAMSSWNGAIEVAERTRKYNKVDKVWIEDSNGKIYE